MSLPETYETIDGYIEACVQFLEKYFWIYDYKNTEILSSDIYRKITIDLRTERVENWPCEFREFFADLQAVKQFRIPNSKLEPLKLPPSYPLRGLKVKKLHELLQLAPVIDRVCRSRNIRRIIDIGSGRGYLPQILHKNYNYSVLGLEAKLDRVEKSRIWQRKYFRDSLDHVQFQQHFIGENSLEFLANLELPVPPESTIADNNNSVCLIGLHCCADLSRTILQLFANWPQAKALVLLPCCYHNLKTFPNSLRFKKIIKNENLTKIPFLRIACQVSESNWADTIRTHAKNTLNRSVIEFVAKKNNYQLKRIKRLPELETIREWTLKVLDNFVTVENREQLIAEIESELEISYRDIFKFENLLWLQTVLQPFFENIVLLDFMEILNGPEIEKECLKVSDDLISPRSNAIIAQKKTIN